MTANADLVTQGQPKVGGACFVAPKGTTLPTDATSILNAAFVNLGYISEDGLTNSTDIESENIKAWGGDVVLTSFKGKTDTHKFKLIEVLNGDVLKAIYGTSNVTVTSDTSTKKETTATKIKSEAGSEQVWVFEQVLKNSAVKRTVIPCGVLTALGDITYKGGEPAGYDATITSVADSSGVLHYEYTSRPTA